MRILVSFVAVNADFRDGRVNLESSPNLDMHRHYWEYDRHLLLSSYPSEDRDPGVSLLASRLRADFGHEVETAFLNIGDVIDVKEAHGKLERALVRLGEEADVDLFMSPGTSAMQIAMFLCHAGGLSNRLVQLRPLRFSEGDRPERVFIDWEQSKVPHSYHIKEYLQEKENEVDYKITESLRPVYGLAERIAQTDVNVFIKGESGTGKEHLARTIHAASPRRNRPLVSVNCSAFDDTLLGSHLFGHTAGAFTGAVGARKGLFREAEGGTVFLDEIGDVSPFMQQALLRAIEEKEILPLGADRPVKVDVRVVSATNRDLPKLCGEGEFRWDLYYRLVVAELELPSLRERGREEIALMLNFFLKLKQKQMGKGRALAFHPTARQFVLNYPFHGNVRELENLVETLYAYYADEEREITVRMLPKRFREIPEEFSTLLKDVEKKHVLHVFALNDGQKKPTARALGVSLNTLKKRLREYGVADDV